MWFKLSYGYLVLILVCVWKSQSCDGFGFNIHHRFSDQVKAIFNGEDEVPEKGTIGYYKSMVDRDKVLHGRRLAGERAINTTLTFASGSTTSRIDNLGFLYYANVSVGTPASWFLVALDTGSSLFWLPCDCLPNCVTQVQINSSSVLDVNIYSLRTSSTGNQLSCTSSLCETSLSCAPNQVHCPYRVEYLSANTSSSGYLVEDVLHLRTDSNSSDNLNVRIPFGCSTIQTGSFLSSGAPNGLLGLSMDPISLPNILARQNHTSNSYSMCFTGEGRGTIVFGDRDSNEQGETPFISNPLNLYDIGVTHITIGTNESATNFNVIFDTGTSFTLLTEPTYSILSEKFDSQIQDRRVQIDPENAFEYCYLTDRSPNELVIPTINLTMGGGDIFTVIDPIILVALEGGQYTYCLAVIESDFNETDVNIIGENFMTGYRIVFDHERMVLGWKAHDCDVAVPVSPRTPVYSPPSLSTTPNNSEESSSSSSEYNYLFICILLTHLLFLQFKNL